jgi:ABC-type lipoprotein export system ATPase subunit
MSSFKRKDADVILSARSLTKRYGPAPGYEAVSDASLDMHAGEFVAIVGRSGSGKSTLMAMLGGLARPTQGQVLLDGMDMWSRTEAELATLRAQHIGFVFQVQSLLANLTAVDNVAVPALLGRTMDAGRAYARAYDLLTRVGLAERADAYPGGLSGGEQRRVVIARGLINSPRILLADEPTSDLDAETESDVIDLLLELQEADAFGFVLVTHDLALASRADRRYDMRLGRLEGLAADPRRPASRLAAESSAITITSARPPRQFKPASPAPITVAQPVRLGRSLLPGLQAFLLTAAVVLGGVLLTDFAVAKYQDMHARERGARAAALEHAALNSLRTEVQSITDLGDGRFQLTTYLQNVGDQSLYLTAPDMRAYVQVASVWEEVPIEAADEAGGGVLSSAAKQTYRYVFDARVRNFAQLLPNYMHVRFSGTTLVSPSSVPKHDVFERKDSYFVYLKPFDVPDEVVLKRMRFPGKPPAWIPMPAH